MAEIARLLARLPHGFPTPIALMKQESTAMQGFCDAGGGTRTPDTRIMIASIGAAFGLGKPSFAGLTRPRSGQICRLGDKVRDKVRARRPDVRRSADVGRAHRGSISE